MSNASHDENARPTLIGVLNSDGSTIKPVCANPTDHSLCVNTGAMGNNMGNNMGNALVDENSVPVFMAESSAGDGTLVEVYVDSTGSLLVTNS